MKTNTLNYKNYVITTEEGVERGIFIRNPIQKVFFDLYYDNEKFSGWNYREQIKNPIRRIYEILMGNWKIIRDINSMFDDYSCGGFYANILCSPIYFKRNFRKLTAISTNTNDNIQSVKSYGYESEFNECAGNCVYEKTTFKLKNKKVLKTKQHIQYNFTYLNIIKNTLDE